MDLPFLLEKGEKIILDVPSVFFSGVGYVNIGFAGGAVGQSGLGGGMFSGKQVKREGSVFDAKPTHVYLTNKRIVFCKAKISMFTKKEKEVGNPITEINYNKIKGMSKTNKLGNAAIDIAVARDAGEIDNLKFWFMTPFEHTKQRDQVFEEIKKQTK